ncbi:hypothetical protein LINPERHAP1_LOCUS30197 [Linum perenne]
MPALPFPYPNPTSKFHILIPHLFHITNLRHKGCPLSPSSLLFEFRGLAILLMTL